MKFRDDDNAYLMARAAFSQKYGMRELWSVIDHWPLYCGVANLARTVAIYELFKQVLHVPGHIVEFGSWRGANLLYLTKLLRILSPQGDKRVFCFDSFEGLSAFTPHDEAKETDGDRAGRYHGSFEELLDVVNLYQMGDEIVITKGLIEETLRPFLAAQPHLAFSLIYCDTDLYASTREILWQMHPHLSKGGVFVFDEWNRDDYPGEGIAVSEFLKKHGECYTMHHVQTARQPNMYIRKIRW